MWRNLFLVDDSAAELDQSRYSFVVSNDFTKWQAADEHA